MKLSTLITCATLLLACSNQEPHASNANIYKKALIWTNQMQMVVRGMSCNNLGNCDIHTTFGMVSINCVETVCVWDPRCDY